MVKYNALMPAIIPVKKPQNSVPLRSSQRGLLVRGFWSALRDPKWWPWVHPPIRTAPATPPIVQKYLRCKLVNSIAWNNMFFPVVGSSPIRFANSIRLNVASAPHPIFTSELMMGYKNNSSAILLTFGCMFFIFAMFKTIFTFPLLNLSTSTTSNSTSIQVSLCKPLLNVINAMFIC